MLDYWDLTLGEITLYIDAYNENQKLQIKRDYLLAGMISNFVNYSLNGKKIPSFEEIYAEPEEDNSVNKLYLDQWKAYAEQHNKKRKEQTK